MAAVPIIATKWMIIKAGCKGRKSGVNLDNQIKNTKLAPIGMKFGT